LPQPQPLGAAPDGAAAAPLALPAELAANVENFFANFAEPQCGHFVDCQSVERTKSSLSRLQPSQ
jgi:ABC-type phosphate/phosphonate transport system substrate-binding protein